MLELRVIRASALSPDTAQTPGMTRTAAVDRLSTGCENLWVGLATIAPGIASGPHHHGDCDSVVCVTAGHIRMKFGDSLEKSEHAGPGDFVFIPANMVHQEINLSEAEPVETIVVRSGDNIVVNVDVSGAG